MCWKPSTIYHQLVLPTVAIPCLLFFSSPVAAQANSSDTAVLTEEMASGLQWSSGSLTGAVVDRNGQKTPVTVNFKLQNHHLSHLSIGTASWTLDISSYVELLDAPFIGRLFVVVAPGPTDSDVRISLPYIDFSKEIGKQCTSLEINASSGKVQSAKSFSVEPERCEP